MRLTLHRFDNSASNGAGANNSNPLFWQRFIWGALAGLVSAFIVIMTPFDVLETSMLEWQYGVADRINAESTQIKISHEVTLVKFDDNSQFHFSITKFDNPYAQRILAQLIEKIERFNPVMVVVDLDLRGATEPSLVSLMQRNRNIVLALFGSPEDGNELPSVDLLKHSAATGRDQLMREANGVVYELPVTYELPPTQTHAQFANPYVGSLAEAVIYLNKQITGVGPDCRFLVERGWTPFYLSPDDIHFPSVSFLSALPIELLKEKGLENRALPESAQEKLFTDKIVMIGTVMTQMVENPGAKGKKVEHIPNFHYQAQAVQTLLNGDQITTLPTPLGNALILFLGVVFGTIFSILKWPARTLLFFAALWFFLLAATFCFELGRVAIPLFAPLVVISATFILATFIFMDASLRVRNRELAEARRSMQVRAEEERQRIAEDLHDETLPTLSAVARMADKLAGELTDNPVPGEMRQRLDYSVAEMRRVINDLHPSVLETMGFKPAIENLLAIMASDRNIGTNFIDKDEFDENAISRFSILQLYRIVQESLNNVQKHSHANNVEVEISRRSDTLIIAVRDDGVGIATKAVRSDSHGILNIKQRAQLIGAKVDWRKPGNFSSGTELRIELSFELEHRREA